MQSKGRNNDIKMAVHQQKFNCKIEIKYTNKEMQAQNREKEIPITLHQVIKQVNKIRPTPL